MIASLLLAMCLTGGPPEEPPHPQPLSREGRGEPDILRLPGPADAVAAAVADLGTLDAADRPFAWYVWLPPWADDRWAGATSYAVNLAISRADSIVLPTPTGNGALLRWDLRQLDPRDTAGLMVRLQGLATLAKGAEPYFGIVVDHAPPEGGTPTKAPPEGGTPTGGTPTRVSAPGAHTGLTNATLLRGGTSSALPIVRADWLVRVALSNVEGGQYYELAGIAASTQEGVTDQAAWLARFGVDERRSKRGRKIRSAAMWRSRVTDKERRVDVLEGDSLEGPVWITHDTDDERQDVVNSPNANLIAFQDAAREAFGMKLNGLPEFALFDNRERLQRVVPPTIARDHLIPSPHTDILQGAISCIRCHGPAAGFLAVQNDVIAMVGSGDDRQRLDVLADLAGKGGLDETLDELSARYLRGLDRFLERSREDHDEAVLRATGGTLDAAQAAAAVSDIYGAYWYEPVDAAVACRELGFAVALREDDVPAAVAAPGEVIAGAAPSPAVVLLRRLLPPRATDVEGLAFDHAELGALKAGLRIGRIQWERVYADAALQAMATVGNPAIEGQNRAGEVRTEVIEQDEQAGSEE
jgi:hypothetical protein